MSFPKGWREREAEAQRRREAAARAAEIPNTAAIIASAQTQAHNARNHTATLKAQLADAEAEIPRRKSDLEHYRKSAGLHAHPSSVLQHETKVRIADETVETLKVDIARAIEAEAAAERYLAKMNKEAPENERLARIAQADRDLADAKERHAALMEKLGVEPEAETAAPAKKGGGK